MGSHRLWYHKSDFEPIDSNSAILSQLLTSRERLIHSCWRTSGTRIPFFDEQFEVLCGNLIRNGFADDKIIDPDKLSGIIKRLLHRNRVFKGALIHIFFLVENNEREFTGEPEMFIISEDFPEEKFTLNQRGLRLVLNKELVHPGSQIMERTAGRSPNNPLWTFDLDKPGMDTACLVNRNNKIVECNDAAIFILKGENLYTPAVEMGLFPRAIRKVILRHSSLLGLRTIETDKLVPKHLNDADEIFIANDLTGPQWVVAYNDKRFFRNYAELFINRINHEWENSD